MSIERHAVTNRYSKAVTHGNTIYLSGLIAENWHGGIRDQTQEIFAQIDTLLHSVGSSKSNLLSMTVWIKDFADYAAYNSEYDAWIDGKNLPARATVRADLLDQKILIEIMCIAAK